MKYLMMMIVGLSLVSCASNHKGDSNREVASADAKPSCDFEKHSSKDWYRVVKGGKPFTKFWYSKNQADKMYDKHVSAGKCH